MNRLPPEAFEYYIGLGEDRSYELVAERFGVSKGAVTKRAKRDDWQERLLRIEREARERIDSRLIESIDAMNTRHLKMMQALQGKALEALKNYPIHNAAAAARVLDIAVARERAIRGTPDSRPGRADIEPGQMIIRVITNVPERETIDVEPEPPKALPEPPRNGHDTRNPSAI